MKQKRKTGRKLLSVLLTLAMVVGLMPGMTTVAMAAGDGTESNPIEVATWSDLKTKFALSTPEGENESTPTYYKLTDNITSNGEWGDYIDVGTGRHVVLDLNGKTIDRNVSVSNNPNGSVIYVRGNLTITDSSGSNSGKITGGYRPNAAGGVNVLSGGTFTLNGGTICGNTAKTYGGGVFVSQSGEFIMNGGTISGNTAGTSGGGVSVYNFDGQKGTFTMNGGTICGNTAVTGGGVYVDGGIVNISGNPIIKDNTQGSDTTIVTSNIYLPDDNKIYVGGALTDGAEIGVTMQTPGVLTHSVSSFKAKDYATYFTSDDSDYFLQAEGDELKLVEHVHDFTYSVNGSSIIATCQAVGCALPPSTEGGNDHVATLTIAPSSSGGYGASLSGDTTLFGVTDDSIEYSSDDGENWISTVPTGIGSYKARITVTDASDSTITYTTAVSYYSITTDKAYTEDADHGTVSVPVVATENTTVTISTTPANGYELESLTATKSGGGTVDVTIEGNNGTFTMPDEAVTVSANFVGKPVTASLNVTGIESTTNMAVLMNDSYEEIPSVTKRAGEEFTMLLNRDDEYDFSITGAEATEFTDEEYQNYFDDTKDQGNFVSPNTVLLHITMPGSSNGEATITVSFAKQQTYTILYQPVGVSDPDMVACKIVRSVNNNDETSYISLLRGATMVDGTAVWSVKMTSAFDPTQIAFVPANKPTTEDEETALATTIGNATTIDATVSQSATWTDITGAKYLIVGGAAKVVTAAFVTDASTMTTYKDNTVNAPETNGGTMYQLAICGTDGSSNVNSFGTVNAPAAPDSAPEGKEFGGWRGFYYETVSSKAIDKIYSVGDSINVRENATFTAVWKPVTLTVTLDRNGGTGGSNEISVPYGDTLPNLENPTRNGFAFDGWTVSKTVTEDGQLFAKGTPFVDFNTKITADMGLTAQWEHVHSYSYYRIAMFDALKDYHQYDSSIHVEACGCYDIKLVAHEFDISGKCACGYEKPDPPDVTLYTSYGQWSNGTYTRKLLGPPETVKRGQEVSIYAPDIYGSLKFAKWQYSTNNSTWYDLTADAYGAFEIPTTMYVRALYVNSVTVPQIDLMAREYEDEAEVNGETYTMDNILFQMNYWLPDGYTFEDAGIRLGDNNGISYYFIQQVRYEYDTESKGIIAGLTAGVAGLGVLANALGGSADPLGLIQDVASADYKGYGVNYLETEENVLDKQMTPATLAQYMFKSKPVNVEKYPPIYWDAQASGKGMRGTVATLPPLRFAQKYGGRNYIYGIGWLKYKKPDGTINTIYTDALPAALKNMPNNTVQKSGN